MVRRPSLDFGSGHDLKVCVFEPRLGLCADSVEPAWDFLSPSPSASPPLACAHVHTLSLFQNKEINIKKRMHELQYLMIY